MNISISLYLIYYSVATATPTLSCKYTKCLHMGGAGRVLPPLQRKTPLQSLLKVKTTELQNNTSRYLKDHRLLMDLMDHQHLMYHDVNIIHDHLTLRWFIIPPAPVTGYGCAGADPSCQTAEDAHPDGSLLQHRAKSIHTKKKKQNIHTHLTYRAKYKLVLNLHNLKNLRFVLYSPALALFPPACLTPDTQDDGEQHPSTFTAPLPSPRPTPTR